MKKNCIEERLSKLEHQVSELMNALGPRTDLNRPLSSLQPGPDEWKQTIGIFKKEDGMKEVFDEALKIRERHRQAFYKAADKRQAAAQKRRRIKS